VGATWRIETRSDSAFCQITLVQLLSLLSFVQCCIWYNWSDCYDVIIQLLKMKCLPVMLYGVEFCALKKSQTESSQFAVNSSFMKIFNTKSMNVVSECLDMFNVLSVADYIAKRKCKFLTRYINSQNSLCNLLCRTAKKVLSDMTLR